MGRRPDSRQLAQLRLQAAREAARLMSEEGVADFDEARRRAARQLGLQRHELPERHEIEAALQLHHELFRASEQPRELHALRHTALHAMQLLAEFQPRLFGRVLEGTADRHTPIQLQLFANASEAVGIHLHHHHIPYRLDEQCISQGRARMCVPLYRFHAGEQHLELWVYPAGGPHLAPKEPLSGQPMEWADRRQLETLLQEGDDPGV